MLTRRVEIVRPPRHVATLDELTLAGRAALLDALHHVMERAGAGATCSLRRDAGGLL